METRVKNIIALGDGLRVSLEVESASTQGLRIRSVDIRRTVTAKFFRTRDWVSGQMRTLARSLKIWDESLEVVEYDQIRELGLLRSAPKLKETWKEYFEMSLEQGNRIVLRRYAYDQSQSRKREIAFGLTQEHLLELVDELGRVLREAPERSEEELAVRAA